MLCFHSPSMASTVALSLIFFSLFPLCSCLPTETIINAAEILSDNGYLSMALTLEAVAQSLLSQVSSVTIFSPSDAAFSQSGQPSLSILQFHFLPSYLSQESLESLALGTKIPTMLAGRSITVTSSQSNALVSLNKVKIDGFPLFDDGSLIVYGAEKFLDFISPVSESSCGTLTKTNPFGGAIGALRSNGYSSMASFLESQILGFDNNQSMITVFAPSDEAMPSHIGNFSEYPNPSLYFRQILPCRISWNDLVNLEDGTELPSYLEGYTMSIARSNGVLKVNGVAVFYPDMYFNGWLVVHGLRDLFGVAENFSKELASSPTQMGNITQEMIFKSW